GAKPMASCLVNGFAKRFRLLRIRKLIDLRVVPSATAAERPLSISLRDDRQQTLMVVRHISSKQLRFLTASSLGDSQFLMIRGLEVVNPGETCSLILKQGVTRVVLLDFEPQ